MKADLTADVLAGPARPAPVHHAAPATPTAAATAAAAVPGQLALAAVLWGMAVAAVAVGVWTLALRNRGGRRAAVAVGGAAVWLVVVYLFFGALAPLLPASF